MNMVIYRSIYSIFITGHHPQCCGPFHIFKLGLTWCLGNVPMISAGTSLTVGNSDKKENNRLSLGVIRVIVSLPDCDCPYNQLLQVL